MTYQEVKVPINVTKKDFTSFYALKLKMARVIDNSFDDLSPEVQTKRLDRACQPLYKAGYKWVHNTDDTFYIHPIWITILSTFNIIKRKTTV